MSDIGIRPPGAMGVLSASLKKRFPDLFARDARADSRRATRDVGARNGGDAHDRDPDHAGESGSYAYGAVEPGTLLAASLLAAAMPMGSSGAAMMVTDRRESWTPPASSLSLRDRTA